jgi:hypothetical protein
MQLVLHAVFAERRSAGMRKTKQQVRESLDLDDLPDDEFMQILAEAGEGPTLTGPASAAAKDHTPKQISAKLSDAIADQAGRLSPDLSSLRG